MRKYYLSLSATCLILTSCGDANFNQIFVSNAQKESTDQLLIEAKYAYDKGKFDEVISLSNKVIRRYPYHEQALVLKSNAYLAKADFDVLGIVDAIVTSSSSSAKLAGTTNNDDTSNLLGKLANAFPLSENDLKSLSKEEQTVKNVTLYIPKDSPSARLTTDTETRMYNLSQAVITLCPLLNNLYPSSNSEYQNLPIYKKGADGLLEDQRYSDCGTADESATMGGRANFTWALANIAEAVAFYSVVMYSSDPVSNVPNIQKATQSLNATSEIGEFLSGLDALTKAVDSIFPTVNADDSMLNAIFDDLATSSVALGSIAGMPSNISDQILNSTNSLKEKIKEITGAKDASNSSAAQQNEALRNTFTKASAEQINSKITQISDPTNKKLACDLYQKLNSDSKLKPAGCP